MTLSPYILASVVPEQRDRRTNAFGTMHVLGIHTVVLTNDSVFLGGLSTLQTAANCWWPTATGYLCDV
ncbi:hypothetical protein OH492_06655 [Vibrio chagasii]|nr:hypothetical protein [Vibrio chagasii]